MSISNVCILQKKIVVSSKPNVTRIELPVVITNTNYSILFTEFNHSTNPADYTHYWTYKYQHSTYFEVCSSNSWEENPIATIIGLI